MIRSRIRRGATVGALCAAVVAAIYIARPLLFGAEWWLFDRYSRHLAASRPPDPRIVLVTVSEDAVRALADFYGRPPYSRQVWALVVGELQRAGAAVIAFDLLFGEENVADPEGDRAFASAIQEAPVVLAADTQPIASDASHPAPARELWNVRGAEVDRRYRLIPPHPMFRPAGGVGTFRIAAPRDSATIHRYPIADRINGGYIASLAVESARHFLGAPRNAAVVSDSFRFAGRAVPVDRSLDMLIRWNGAKSDARALSYARVDLHRVILAALAREEGSIPPETLAQFGEQFRGRIVLVGNTAAGLMDLRANPLSPVAPGVEIHANAIDNLINADFNRVANRWLMLPLILAIGAIFGAAVELTRSQIIAAIVALVGIGAVAALGYGALTRGLMVPAFTASVVIALTYVTITVLKFVREQQQTAHLKQTFGRYVSPQILDHILAHPEKVQLGGERRDLTILFSDIRGFTSISESSEPEEVVEMLNEYLTRMVDILLAHGGTLDKFIGDAVMGFWNAPAADPDHPRNAVLCAVAMIEETARLREQWQAEGKPAIRIGIGINSGEAVVGNIGSQRVFGYTVIGDAVNLASRLEGKNKDYVTEIIVSESTLERMGDGFETVYLDDVKVKGKEKAVRIYEVKGIR